MTTHNVLRNIRYCSYGIFQLRLSLIINYLQKVFPSLKRYRLLPQHINYVFHFFAGRYNKQQTLSIRRVQLFVGNLIVAMMYRFQIEAKTEDKKYFNDRIVSFFIFYKLLVISSRLRSNVINEIFDMETRNEQK